MPPNPAHVSVVRAGRRLTSPRFLQVGDQIRVAVPGSLRFSYAGDRYSILPGRVTLQCRSVLRGSGVSFPGQAMLTVGLQSGRVSVRVGRRPSRALVATREMIAYPKLPGTEFVVQRNPGQRRTRAWTLNNLIVAARTSDPRLAINVRVTYTAISDARGLRLDIWPFSISSDQRATTPADHLVPYWADGLPCSVGCTPPGVVPGWPLKPFRRQHAIRAGINELRPANFHVGVDIEAQNFESVYAIQSGYATIRYPGTGDVNVDVGRFDYWHIDPAVTDGQYVVAYKTRIGQVLRGFGHIAFSEGTPSDYLNPLRPGGSLRPYRNTEPPIIGIPRLFADGRVIVRAFDPQSFIAHESYETPVLAPSSLAWRLYDSRGRALTGLEWAMRGSQNYPPSLKPVIFAPGASNPGFACFYRRRRCIPNWAYWLAGGLTEPLPLGGLAPGRYRLTVYAWDWAGNTSALDYWLKLPLATSAVSSAAAESGPLDPRFDYP